MRGIFSRAYLFFLILQLVCSIAFAMDDWMTEFNVVCGKTQIALTFTSDELNTLISRCDALKPRIEKLDESQATERKVFLHRLKMCREFYAFALGTKAEQK